MSRAFDTTAASASDTGWRSVGDAARRVAPRGHAFEQAARASAPPRATGHGGRLIDGPIGLAGGQALPSADRLHFEHLYGHDFSAVRIHADRRANDSARELRAHAFTSGTHVAFASGRWQPGTQCGRALLAHELVHVAQVQAAGAGSAAAATVWRAAEDEPLADAAREPELGLAVTTSAGEAASHNILLHQPDEPVDSTDFKLYEGDVLALSLLGSEQQSLEPVVDSLPDALQRTDLGSDSRLLLRATAVAPSVVLRVHAAGEQTPSAVLTLSIQPRPQPQGTVDPELAANESARTALDAERSASRTARRNERRELRGASRKDRREARRARRAERRDERQRTRELRKERAQLVDDSTCSLETQRALDAAQRRGVQVCEAALGALARSPQPHAAALAALATYMKIDSVQSPEGKARLQRVIDVLSTARNSLADAGPDRFECGNCEETSGAKVIQNTRGGMVTICQMWRIGSGLKFDLTATVDDARAYALVHEFVHLSGPSARGEGKEHYVADGSAWAELSPQQVLKMADAYAAVAWAAGTGSAR